MAIISNSKIKIAVISHTLAQRAAQQRWRCLAKNERYEIHLLTPKHWVSTWFIDEVIFDAKRINSTSFHVHPLPTTNTSNWGKYFFRSIDAKFREIQPDLIYILHEESVLIHQQIYLYKRLYAPNAKIVFFSMNALGVPHKRSTHPLKKIFHRILWENIKRNTDAAIVHYPGCLESLRDGRYDKPVFLQTQVGYDESIFRPSRHSREKYRKKLNLHDKFVIGFSGRLATDKGVDDLMAVFINLTKKNNKLNLLLVGNGELKDELDKTLKQENITSRVHITGFVKQSEVPAYMNAMDVFVLGSKTTSHWIDTFPLVTVQAQAVGLPVIASDSASLPWQLADTALIYPEGNRVALEEAILKLYENVELRQIYAKKGKTRSLNFFCHNSLTKNFMKIVDQVLSGEYQYHKKNETYTQWKAY